MGPALIEIMVYNNGLVVIRHHYDEPHFIYLKFITC